MSPYVGAFHNHTHHHHSLMHPHHELLFRRGSEPSLSLFAHKTLFHSPIGLRLPHLPTMIETPSTQTHHSHTSLATSTHFSLTCINQHSFGRQWSTKSSSIPQDHRFAIKSKYRHRYSGAMVVINVSPFLMGNNGFEFSMSPPNTNIVYLFKLMKSEMYRTSLLKLGVPPILHHFAISRFWMVVIHSLQSEIRIQSSIHT